MNANFSGIIAIILWSISPLLIIGTGNTPPFLLGFLTLIIASVTLFIKYLAIDGLSFKSIIKHDKLAYVVTTYGIGGYICFWFLAFDHAPAFEANTLNYLWPILLVGFSMLLKRASFSIIKLAGLILAFTGVILIFFNKENMDINLNYTLGYSFALTGALIWASYSILTHSVKFTSYAMAAFMVPPAIIFLILHILKEPVYMPNNLEILSILCLGLTRISFSFWDYAMKHADISFIGSLAYFIPVISTFFLMLFGFMPRNDIILLSAIFVIGGCLIVNYKNFRKNK